MRETTMRTSVYYSWLKSYEMYSRRTRTNKNKQLNFQKVTNRENPFYTEVPYIFGKSETVVITIVIVELKHPLEWILGRCCSYQ